MLVEKIIDYSRTFYTLLGERRKAERLEFTCTVTVSCKNRYGSLTTNICSCLNLSDRGIGLQSSEPLPINCDVYIHSETHNLKRFGRVQWCVQRGDRFYAGCKFSPTPDYWN